MIKIFSGKKGSGTLQAAEQYTAALDGSKYYIAAMRVKSDEDRARVAALRQRREGLDFVTIEQDSAIVKAIDKIKWMESLLGNMPDRRVALIADMPTLCANEMFLADYTFVEHKNVENTILFGIAFLKEFFDDIVIVTEDNPSITDYNPDVEGDEAIAEYSAAMSELNAAIARFAEN